MNRWFKIFCSSILAGCLFTSCGGGFVKKQNRMVSREAYAIDDSLRLGRFDLGSEHSKLLVQIVPPPDKKDRIVIKPFRATLVKSRDEGENSPKIQQIKKSIGNVKVDVGGKYFGLPDSALGENIVVLPEGFKENRVIVENSAEYEALLSERKDLRDQVAVEKKEKIKLQEKVDDLTRQKQEIVEKFEEQKIVEKHTFWGKVKFWGKIAACVAGAGLLIYFFPPIIGVSISLLRGVKRILQAMFRK